MVDLYVVLKHNSADVEKLHDTLMDVSTPSSDKYGQHLSIEEVKDILNVNANHTAFVTDHFVKQGAQVTANGYGDILSVRMSAQKAEKFFDAKMYHWKNVNAPAGSSTSIIRAGTSYHLPDCLAEVVSFVDNMLRFPKLSFHPIIKDDEEETIFGGDDEFDSCDAKTCTGKVTPAVLQARYGYPTIDSGDVAANNRMAVAEFQTQFYDTDDMDAFTSGCKLTNPVTVDKNIGGNRDGLCKHGLESCVESLLDIEYIKAVGGAIPLDVYYSATFSLLDWATKVNDDEAAAQVHSVSYGNDEIQQTSEEYMYSVNTEFMKLGARGISVLFASGDQGVWGRTGKKRTDPVFNPDFPGGSPYVTVVGGTNFVKKGEIGDETAWNNGGGGFSNTFPTADWQAEAVSGYFKTSADTLPPANQYNATGRGYPDVSALAGETNTYCVAVHGKFMGVAGTSAASPVVAGLFAILNNERLSNGGAPLGFANPFLYGCGEDCFYDVKSGNNGGVGGGGFDAVEGWDAATGWGTVNYEGIKAKALA